MIVVGGGVSGLSTVYHLLEKGFVGRIALLEARDRLGGRIWTSKTKINEEKIEFGANWIHGIIGNPVYSILCKKGIVEASEEDDAENYHIRARSIDGKEVDTCWVKKVYEAYTSITKKADSLAEQHDDVAIESCRDSMGVYVEAEFKKWCDSEVSDEEHRKIVLDLFGSLVNRENCITGSHSLDEVSLQYIGTYQQFLGGHLTIPKGYYSFIKSLREDIDIKANEDKMKDKFQLFTQTVVTNIEWPGVGEESSATETFPIKISTADGRTFKARHVIVTLPLGYLKQHADQLFRPKLPAEKRQSIERMGFGIVDKIFLEYSRSDTIAKLFKKDGLTTNEMMLLWDLEQRDAATGRRPWYHKVYSIYYISDHCVQLWATGNEALELEGLDENTINTQITEQFRKFFDDPNFPRADNVIVTRWGREEYTLGSYSFIRRGSSPKDIEHLQRPIYHRAQDSLVS